QLLANSAHRRPATRRVGRDAIAATTAEETPERLAERLAQEVPERDVHAAQGAHRDPAPPDRGERPALAERVMRARSAIEQLPDPGDVAGVAPHEARRDLLADQRDQRSVVAEVADRRFGLAKTSLSGVGLDLDETGIERIVPAEVADVCAVGRNASGQP